MDISCAFPANSAAVEAAVLAEELARRVWSTLARALPRRLGALARIAERTERIGLGPGVLVPHLRHPMTQAAAIARRRAGADGWRWRWARVTGRLAMGQPMLSRKQFEGGVRQVMALLQGEVVEVDGAATQMLHSEGLRRRGPSTCPSS